jgi:hypothetical protein
MHLLVFYKEVVNKLYLHNSMWANKAYMTGDSMLNICNIRFSVWSLGWYHQEHCHAPICYLTCWLINNINIFCKLFYWGWMKKAEGVVKTLLHTCFSKVRSHRDTAVFTSSTVESSLHRLSACLKNRQQTYQMPLHMWIRHATLQSLFSVACLQYFLLHCSHIFLGVYPHVLQDQMNGWNTMVPNIHTDSIVVKFMDQFIKTNLSI